MSALSAAQADAFALLREDICEHLERAESLAFQDDDWSAEDIATARDLIGDLVLGIRGLMIEHEMHGDGQCRTCAGAWPCLVMVTIHGFVKDPEGQFALLAKRNRSEN